MIIMNDDMAAKITKTMIVLATIATRITIITRTS